jgi:hypothetical protein
MILGQLWQAGLRSLTATFSGRGPGEAWFPGPLNVQILFAFFFGAREDQPVLLRSRAICRLSPDFFGNLQDRHRPPSDLADGLMRILIRAKRLIGQKSGYSHPRAGISRGGSPLYGKLEGLLICKYLWSHNLWRKACFPTVATNLANWQT